MLNSTAASEILALADIINHSVKTIHEIYDAASTTHPSLNDAHDPASPAEQLTLDPHVLNAALLATSAAAQLIATLRLPGLALCDRAYAYHVPAALRIATEACVAEILREAGPHGLDAKHIAAKAELDAAVLARTLRLLASHYVFKEVSPNVFTNNRLSSLLDTGKSSKVLLTGAQLKRRNQVSIHREISDLPGEKHAKPNGIPALIEHFSEETFKSASYFPDVVLANDYSQTAWQRAFNYPDSVWKAREANPGRLQRFHMVMVGDMNARPQDKIFEGFDWTILPEGALVVDVGGGNGSASLEIAQRAPHLKIMVQDREETIKRNTMQYWKNDAGRNALLESGQVVLHAHDFFKPQPSSTTGRAALFYMRRILHDWPTATCVAILKLLNGAAGPSTRLMIVDHVVPYACPTPASLVYTDDDVSGNPAVPQPLLANLGEARAEVYALDFTMGAQHGAQERTIGEFKDLTEAAGWRIEKVYCPVGSVFSQIVCAKT